MKRIKSGTITPSARHVVRAARLLGVGVDDVLGGSGPHPAFVAVLCLLGAACKDTTRPPIETPADVGVQDANGGEPNDGSDPPPDVLSPDPGAPRVLFDRGTQGPKALHASESDLYWYESNIAEGPRVLSAPKDGSRRPEALAPTESLGGYGFIASDDEYAYWVESERIVRRKHGQAASIETFPLGRPFTYPFIIRDGKDLYVTDIGCFLIARVSTATFEVTMLREEDNAAGGGGSVLVSDASDVYCSTGPLSTVIAVSKSGDAVREVARAAEGYGIAGIALGGGQLFFLQVPHSLGQSGQMVVQVTLSSGAMRELATVAIRGGASQLFFDESHGALYWVDGTSRDAGLHRLEVASSSLTTLVQARGLSGQQRRRWREGARPRGTRKSKSRPGLRAGSARPMRSTVCTKPPTRTKGSGSRHCCIT